MNNIKYRKSVLWLKPFVDSVNSIVPLEKITYIKGYKVRKGLNEQAYATALKERGKFNINIRVYDLDDDKQKHKNGRISVILDSLAHELSHIVHWEHTPDHFRLQARILHKFAKVLEKEGILDSSARVSHNQIKKCLED